MRSGVPVPWFHSRSAGAAGGGAPAAHAASHYSGGSDALAGALDATTVTASGAVTLTAGPLTIESAGNEKIATSGAALRLASDGSLQFFNNADIGSGAADAGLKRSAAGGIEATNGGAGTGFIKAGNLKLLTNTLSSEDANGAILLDPNGTGPVQVVSGLLQFHGSTSAFPALRRASAYLEIRVADDSEYGFVATRQLDLKMGSSRLAALSGNAGFAHFYLASGIDLIWSSSATEGVGSNDTGLKRLAAGKLQGTDGAAGSLTAFQLTATVGLFQGTGSPEGAVTAGIGSLFMRTDGGAGTSAYVKESGTGNTGWKALVGV